MLTRYHSVHADTVPAEVVVVGAGPAGLTLANLLRRNGIGCVVLERQSRRYVENRARAGLLEYRAVEMLRSHGLADRLLELGAPHGVCEFRIGGKRFILPYSDLYEGRTHYVYPQQELVKDLIEAFVDSGGDIRFEAKDVALHGISGSAPSVTWVGSDGEQHRVRCEFIAGCDGFRGVSRPSIPAGGVREFSHQPGIAWLGVLAEVPPSTEHVIYALHPKGFAGHMLRSPTVSRFFLQCPVDDSTAAWPDDRIWAELHERFAVPGSDWKLSEGRIIEKGVVDMRGHVTEPMAYGRLFLLGDAAHVITPVGAKGMNLALHDAEVLATALAGYYRGGDESGLTEYSETCLRRVWRCQEFSQWMTTAIHGTGDRFEDRTARTRLENLFRSPASAAWFAENYVGLM
ncbi:4-hydroxybenzoate 3-monooxygenase [Allokutzneria albata]|uniref:p-hydroxybenzoate 3-monooxygenase n=1 Tax=Allokutzneria albata TaxID=211114 RepID=A0A1G9UXM9_ALLAB|nr:4-hydroxybenzoate 3-monooxygenase [Allokutzneria albata]SDM64569.1 p-hydroxybenzoate 3-monooxygenase [Allokutzneria albata]